MPEEIKQKKKVYVETTVVSDATALPSKDLILAGRQIVSREWLERADLEYELGMTTEMRYDEGLEEIWRIKREIASEYPTLEDYFKGMMDYQEELRHQGVKFVRLPPREPEPAMA